MQERFNRGSQADGVPPGQDGNPSRTSENSQLQWVIESISQLKISHETSVSHMNHKLESLDQKLDAKHQSFDEKIDSQKQLLSAQLENTELKLQKSMSDSKVDSIKWIIGLAIGLPSVMWAIVQIVKTFAK